MCILYSVLLEYSVDRSTKSLLTPFWKHLKLVSLLTRCINRWPHVLTQPRHMHAQRTPEAGTDTPTYAHPRRPHPQQTAFSLPVHPRGTCRATLLTKLGRPPRKATEEERPFRKGHEELLPFPGPQTSQSRIRNLQEYHSDAYEDINMETGGRTLHDSQQLKDGKTPLSSW